MARTTPEKAAITPKTIRTDASSDRLRCQPRGDQGERFGRDDVVPTEQVQRVRIEHGDLATMRNRSRETTAGLRSSARSA